MNHFAQCLVALVAAGAVLTAAIPEADSARKASLADSRLITDKNDVYLFPQVGVDHSQLISLDYGQVYQSGSGLALLGDEAFTFGLGVYRGDLLDQGEYFPHQPSDIARLGNIANPIGESDASPHTIADLFASMDTGAAQLGARVSFGAGGFTGVTAENERFQSTQSFGALTLGFSLVDDLRIDASLTSHLSFGADYDEQQDHPEMLQGDGYSFLIGGSARGYVPMQEGLEVGFLADVYFDTEGWSSYPQDPDQGATGAANQFSILGGAGPIYTINNTELAGYAVLGYQRVGVDDAVHDPNQPGTFASQTVLPGLHLAADIELFDWLFFRSGIQYSFSLATDGGFVTEGRRANQFERQRLGQFGWRTGIGVEVGQFSLDGAFEQGFITGGPAFLGDPGDDGMFTMVSATYQF